MIVETNIEKKGNIDCVYCWTSPEWHFLDQCVIENHFLHRAVVKLLLTLLSGRAISFNGKIVVHPPDWLR